MPKKRTRISSAGFGFIKQKGGGYKKATGLTTDSKGKVSFGRPAGKARKAR